MKQKMILLLLIVLALNSTAAFAEGNTNAINKIIEQNPLVANYVKELKDTITSLTEKNSNLEDTVKSQQEKIEQLNQTIEDQKQTINTLNDKINNNIIVPVLKNGVTVEELTNTISRNPDRTERQEYTYKDTASLYWTEEKTINDIPYKITISADANLHKGEEIQKGVVFNINTNQQPTNTVAEVPAPQTEADPQTILNSINEYITKNYFNNKAISFTIAPNNGYDATLTLENSNMALSTTEFNQMMENYGFVNMADNGNQIFFKKIN